jgi:hypothetical protein
MAAINYIANEVYKIYLQWFEPERHDRSKQWIYRNKIKKEFNISYKSFERYLKHIEKNNKSC